VAYSVDWTNRIVTVPQSDLTLIQAAGANALAVYELDVADFWREVRRLESEVPGLPNPIIVSNTAPAATDSVTTLPRVVRVINGYRVEFDDSPGNYQVRLVGGNTNIHDTSVLVPNGVSVVPSNSAGLVLAPDSSGADVNVTSVGGVTVSGPDDLKADLTFLEAIEGGTWKIEDDGSGNAVQVFYDASNVEVARVQLYRKDGQPVSMTEFDAASITERRRV